MVIITLQRKKCIGCNYCVELAPKQFQMSKKDGKSVIDKSRENEVIKRLTNLNKGPLNPDDLNSFFNKIIMLCREIQNPK